MIKPWSFAGSASAALRADYELLTGFSIDITADLISAEAKSSFNFDLNSSGVAQMMPSFPSATSSLVFVLRCVSN
jgi:hypothetical protein